jgi:predicted amidohydrolase
VVAPWGEVIARAEHDEPCALVAELDLAAVAKARAAIPALVNDRPFSGPVIVPESDAAVRSAAE